MEHYIGPLLTFVVVVAGLAVAWGKWNVRLDAIEKCTQRIETSCLQYRTTCQGSNRQELIRLSDAFEDLVNQKNHRWEELDKTLSSIDRFMGRVEQYMSMKNGIVLPKDSTDMGGKMK